MVVKNFSFPQGAEYLIYKNHYQNVTYKYIKRGIYYEQYQW